MIYENSSRAVNSQLNEIVSKIIDKPQTSKRGVIIERRGTVKIVIKKREIEVVMDKMFMIKISLVNLLSFTLSFLIDAASLMAYELIPSPAMIEKYETIDCAKRTFPIPSGIRIRDVYGNVIRG